MSAAKPHLVYALEHPLVFGGGVSVIVRTLMTALRDEYRLSLVSPDTPEELAAAGLADSIEHHLPWKSERASAARARAMAQAIAAWQPDLVHFHSGANYGWGNRRPGTAVVPRLHRAGIPCISTVHLVISILSGLLPPASPWWVKAAALPIAWLGKMQSLAGTAVEIAVSEHDAAHLRKWYAPFRRRIRRIYHSQLPAVAERPVSPAARERVILNVGHRALRKGQDVLVEAFTRIALDFPEWRLHLVGPPGDEDFEAQLARTIAAGGLAQRVTIEPSRADVAELMRRAAVYVQPSLHEALGLALQEALFHGCACIGARAGGIPELIDSEQTGLLTPAGDRDALAAALRRLLADEALRSRFSEAAPASIIARGMTAPAMIEAHRKLYAEVIHGE